MTNDNDTVRCQVAGSTRIAHVAGAGGLTDVLVVPDGQVKSQSGDFILDLEAWKLIEAAYKRLGRAIVVDYEHQTVGGEFASPDGKAPAAGWIYALRYAPGKGIVAAVQWTGKAREMIRAGEYGYPSPVLSVRKSDRRAVELHHVGLTNDPAIERIDRLAAKRTDEKETKVMSDEPQVTTGGDPTVALARIAEVLGVEDNADVGALTQTILEAVRKLKSGDGGGEEATEPTASSRRDLAALAKAAGAPDDASEEVVIATITTLKQGAANLAEMQKQIHSLQGALTARDANDFLAPYRAKDVVGLGATKEDCAADEKMIVNMAAERREDCERILSQRVAMQPPQGRVTPATDADAAGGRQLVIAKARAEFDANPQRAVTDRVTYVNGALLEGGLSKLTDAEKAAPAGG